MTELRRRAFLGGCMAIAVLPPGTAAPQPSRLAKIGALTESWGPTPAIVGLREGLRELGFREDRDFAIGIRFTEGKAGELPAAARDLVRHRIDLLVATETGSAARAAQAATKEIPIVFVGIGDPVGLGLVQSLARPGGNITGVADLDTDLIPKRLELFRDLVPGLKRVLMPYDAANPEAVTLLKVHQDAARRLGLTLIEKPVRNEEEARATITGFRKADADGVITMRLLSSNVSGFVLDVAPRGGLPTMFHIPYFVERGGLASYGANLQELGKQAARLVDRILKGAKPADLPVEQPLKFELAVNVKTAKALGITIPPALLLRADRVID
jgi:putative ABC transport system substrate-binding protein